MAHVQQSKHILDDFAKQMEDVATVEKAAKLEGRNMSMVLAEKHKKTSEYHIHPTNVITPTGAPYYRYRTISHSIVLR